MKLPSTYEPGKYESDIYALWEREGVFKADPASDKPHFSIAMPPPNETGTLHAGHAIGLTLEDVMCRHARQQGKDVLWLPGTDHAALATNAIIEKRLAEQGTNKHELGRDRFIAEVKNFVADSRQTMNAQIRAIGASCDWSRARYTLDDALNRCVNEVFVKMFDDGLIYRGHRIVNWDPNLETTVSDDEVVYQDEVTPLYTLRFGPFQISTARPETKFGDKYVVMHPADERYKRFKDGQTFEAEWINGPITATVVKDEAIDPEFGTGVMTITPWHDHTDFDIAERHGLEKEQIIGMDGRLLAIAGEFAGMPISEARPKIIEKLRAKGLVIAEDKKYKHRIAQNDRGKGVIEPQVMLQWFVDVNRPVVNWKGQLLSLKQVMRAVIEDGDIKIIPKRFEKVYYHWIDNLRDWCISRQIWWGHRIPVWYKGEEIFAGVQPPAGQGWAQDTDTLDTWFSSALWTWSTLIDRELAKDYHLSLEDLLAKSKDYQTYHPTSVMETGWDILFFWVARMILATTYATGQLPFKTVYLHGLVRTESGKKMSKSEPDSIVDPSEVIGKYGADALRLALIGGTAPGADQRLGESRVAAARNFNNKLWNIARYIEANAHALSAPVNPGSPADHWILNKLSISQKTTAGHLNNFRFNDAYETMYHYVWDDLADWYIEASKSQPNPGVLAHALKQTLLLAHPFAPFVTEAIWQQLGWEKGSVLAAIQAGAPAEFSKEQSGQFESVKQAVQTLRQIKALAKINNFGLAYNFSEPAYRADRLIAELARIKTSEKVHASVRIPGEAYDLLLDIDETQLSKARAALTEQRHGAKASIDLLKKRLVNKAYLANAPEGLVAETKRQLSAEEARLALIEAEIKALG